MKLFGMWLPDLLVMIPACLIYVLVFYWTVRFAVKHGVKDALRERGEEDTR